MCRVLRAPEVSWREVTLVSACASRASRLTPSARTRRPAQFRPAEYLPSGDFPAHDERDALRALLRGLGSEVLCTSTFLTSYALVCDEASSAYFAEFKLWTPGVRAGARDSSSGEGVEARPLTAYRPGDPEPWVLFSGAAPPSEEACDWHEAVQELFTRCAPGQLRSDYQTLETACLERAPPDAADTARCLWDFLTRTKKRAAKTRKEAAETTVEIDVVKKQLADFTSMVGLHLVKWRWCDRPAGADDNDEPVALYTLCAVDSNLKIVIAPERSYKQLNAAERAYINSPGAMSLYDPATELVDATHLESRLRDLEANLERMAALTDDEYERVKWLCRAAETLVDFFTAKLVKTTVPRKRRVAAGARDADAIAAGARDAKDAAGARGSDDDAADDARDAEDAAGARGSDDDADGARDADDEERLSDSDGKKKRDPFAWRSDEEEEEEEEESEEAGPPASKKAKLVGPGMMRTCKFNFRTGKRCGSSLKEHNSVRCACLGGATCRAAKKHAGVQCPCGSHIRCVPEATPAGEWRCSACLGV